MTNHQHTKGPRENPPEQPGDREGIKDVLSRSREDVDVKKPPVEVMKGVEKEERRVLERMDREVAGVSRERWEECFALAGEVKDEVVEPNTKAEEVAQQSALALREQATEKGMPLKELAFENLRKVEYPQMA